MPLYGITAFPAPPQVAPAEQPQSRSLVDRLRDVGGYVADRFQNPPEEPSLIGMFGSAYRGLTSPMPAYGDTEGMAQKVNDLSTLAMPGGFLFAPRGALGSSGSRFFAEQHSARTIETC